MPRNYVKENEWRKRKYRTITFTVDIPLADKYQEHLRKHGVKPAEWFKYAINMGLVPPGNALHYDGNTTASSTEATASSMEATSSSTEATASSTEMVEVEVATACTSEKTLVPRQRKKHMPSPPPELVEKWRMMRGCGMTYGAIALKSEGYEASTIRKNLAKENANDKRGDAT